MPCLQKYTKETQWNRLLPAQWSVLPEGRILSALDTPHAYIPEEQVFNKEWMKKVPISYIETEQEREKKLEEFTLTLSTASNGNSITFYIIATTALSLLAFVTIALFFKLQKILEEVLILQYAVHGNEHRELTHFRRKTSNKKNTIANVNCRIRTFVQPPKSQ